MIRNITQLEPFKPPNKGPPLQIITGLLNLILVRFLDESHGFGACEQAGRGRSTFFALPLPTSNPRPFLLPLAITFERFRLHVKNMHHRIL